MMVSGVSSSESAVFERIISLPAHGVMNRSFVPPLYDNEYLYPYQSYLLTDNTPKYNNYRTISISNDCLKVTVIPDLGGRIYQIEDIRTGQKYLHDNDIVRPVRIPPRWNYISMGIELNFPLTHSPTGNEPVGYELLNNRDGCVGVAVGEREMMWGLCWRAEIKLFPNLKGVCISVRCWNPTKVTREIQWWSNAGQPAEEDTEFIFPEEPILAHIEGEESGHWPMAAGIDRRWHKNYDNMFGSFHEPTTTDWFGIYHHEKKWGLLHLADPKKLPGKKMWTFGHTGPTFDWPYAMGRKNERICEIQSGIPTTQKDFYTLAPGQELEFVEFWIPITHRTDFDDANRPTFESICRSIGGIEKLRALKKELPSPAGQFWKDLISVHAKNNTDWLSEKENDVWAIWPPTGLELEAPLMWAAKTGLEGWQYALAVWHTVHKQPQEALSCLDAIQHPLASSLRGLILWKDMNQPTHAWEHLKPAVERLIDGQLFCHANQLLRELGSLEERKKLIDLWPEADYRRRETLAEIALDSGNPKEAIRILTHEPWERHHCRWRRTELWFAARKALNKPTSPIPTILGEDPYRVSG